MIKIFKYSFFDLMRSSWSYVYFAFYLVTTLALLYFSGDVSKAIVSLMTIVIILSPLIGTMFGVLYYYNSREFIELLLAQPVKRSHIFIGQYLGLSSSLVMSFLLGLGIPFLIFGIWDSGMIGNFITLLLIGTLLTFIFTAIAFLIALKNENRLKGFGTAIIVWLFLAVLYDGLFLLILILFESYPVEKLAIGITLLNPIDLSRILMMLKLDISALLGYTGAVFNKFFGTSMGMIIALAASMIWFIVPMGFILRLSKNKDF